MGPDVDFEVMHDLFQVTGNRSREVGEAMRMRPGLNFLISMRNY